MIYIDRFPIGFAVEQTKMTIRGKGSKGTRMYGAELNGKGTSHYTRTLLLTEHSTLGRRSVGTLVDHQGLSKPLRKHQPTYLTFSSSQDPEERQQEQGGVQTARPQVDG